MNETLLDIAKKYVEPYGAHITKTNDALVIQFQSMGYRYTRRFEWNNLGLALACEWARDKNQDVYRRLPDELIKAIRE